MRKNNFYKNKTILITGGAGSIGSELVKALFKFYGPKTIRILDNNETGLFNLDRELSSPEKISPFVGDVRDISRLKRAMEEVDIVFHAAALKHVPLCEYNPFEAVKTNILGTQNVIDAALTNNVKVVINISTDKAVNPINVMGATKLLAERLISAANNFKGKKRTIFSSVRFGNVLGSRGSMIPIFVEQIKKGGPVTVTDSNMKRFVMTLSEAIDLVLKVAPIAKGGETFILKMPALRVYDLAEVMIEKLAPIYNYSPKQIKIKRIGKREGEKFQEALITKNELENAFETKEMFIICPDEKKKNWGIKNIHRASPHLKEEPLLTKQQIRKLGIDTLIR